MSEVAAENGAVAAHYEYAPFGAAVAYADESADINPWLFSGEYDDGTVGVVYYNYRYFQTYVGRWVSMDPTFEFGGLNLYCFIHNDPVLSIDRLGLLSTGVKSCVRYYKSCTWHAYLQVGNWTMGWASQPQGEDLTDNSARGCTEMELLEDGVMPDGKPCKCATAEELQKCVQDKSNWPFGTYALFGGRNCGTWAKEVAKRCCMKAKFSAPWFDPNAEGCGNIGGPIYFGPSYGWKWPKRKQRK